MDYKYLIRRYRTFRGEYLELSSRWLKGRWSWLWNFSIDICKFLYRGEINHIRMLRNTLRQKNDYITLLRTGRGATGPHAPAPAGKNFHTWINLAVKILLLPVSFLVYWIRRCLRMLAGRQCRFLITADSSATDSVPEATFEGSGPVRLTPEKGRFPGGLVILRYALEVTEGTSAPMLFIDSGIGFTGEYSVPLPYGKTEAQELLLEMPPYTESLLFQVGSGKALFRLQDFSMTEISLLQAARYQKSRYGYTLNDILHSLFICKLPGVRRILAHKITYAEWHYKYAVLTTLDRKAILLHIGTLDSPPLLSLVIDVDSLDAGLLDQSLHALRNQLYRNWEVLITCSEIPDAHISSTLNHHERADDRVRIVIDQQTAGIARNATHAITACRGTHTCLLGTGDLLAEHALYLIACWILEHPEVNLIYTDHDYMDEYGGLSDPCLKPDWNHEFLLGKNYLQQAVFYKTGLLASVLAENPLDPGNENYRLNLEFTGRIAGKGIDHIPYILLHRRQSISPAGTDAGRLGQDQSAVEAYLSKTGQPASVIPVQAGFRVRRSIPESAPLISLIVLTRDRVALLSHCIDGILNRTGYKNIEVIIVDNGSSEPATLDYLASITRDPRVRVLPRPTEFNFSGLNNFAVEHAAGDYLGLINNDISIIGPDWLEEMVSQVIRPEVGVVGAKLLYENDTIQHAGVIIGLGGVAGHALRYAPRHYRGYDDRLMLTQELSCVTAACLLTKKDVYKAVGGLDDVNLKVAFNDVDYCLKVREHGLKIIWTPFAELYHLESASRGSDLSKENIDRWTAEYNYMRKRWQRTLETDPYYNPNLGITDEEFALAQPPRLFHPWESYRQLPINDTARRSQ